MRCASIAGVTRAERDIQTAPLPANTNFAIGPWLGATIFEKFGPTALWSGLFIVCAFSSLLFLRLHDQKLHIVP